MPGMRERLGTLLKRRIAGTASAWRQFFAICIPLRAVLRLQTYKF